MVPCVACGRPRGPVCPLCTSMLRPGGVVEVRGVDEVRVLLSYAGPGRELVQALKYRNRRAALALLSRALAERLDDGAADAVTWVPALPANRRRRGYDQAQLLARHVGRRCRLPVRRLLVRRGDRSQTGLDRAARLAGPDVVARGRVPPRVLVVDDVVTTGSSLGAAARALRAGGASQVRAAVLAATPAPVG